MSRTEFYATRADFEEFIRAVEAQQRFQYVAQRDGGDRRETPPPVYASALDLPWPGVSPRGGRLEWHDYRVVDVGVAVSVTTRTIGSATPNPYVLYTIGELPGQSPVSLSPGGATEEGVFCQGTLWADDIDDPNARAKYRLFSQALIHRFTQVHDSLLGPEALRLLESGGRLRPEGGDFFYERQWLDEWRELEALRLTRGVERLSREESVEYLVQTGEWTGADLPADEDEDWEEDESEEDEDDEDEDDGDDDDEYVSESLDYFRTACWGRHWNCLTLPRSYFAKTDLERCSFRNTDLSGSRIVVNDIVDCDFREADLTGACLASLFVECDFSAATLNGADLRRSTFIDCTFAGASMQGTKLLQEDREALPLSSLQFVDVEWSDDSGPEPPEA